MALLRDGFEQCVDDAEKRCFEQQDKLQALLLGSLANVPGHLDLCRTSPKLAARVLRFLKAAWLRAEPPRSAAFHPAAAAWCRVLDALEQARGTDPQLVPVLRSGDHLMLAFHPCLEGCERQSLQYWKM
ncbi:unnamed protein product [Symbiodinium necroappetens]|uniref:Uncharacterized protein n=1 Tax=Symbiodinium necroappetens TaxID=1628268 RepID=A0A812TK39_9DINO|nr:unnamed protein product [Symbiodinium necroappetens]